MEVLPNDLIISNITFVQMLNIPIRTTTSNLSSTYKAQSPLTL